MRLIRRNSPGWFSRSEAMKLREERFRWLVASLSCAAVVLSAPVVAQSLSDTVESVSGSASAYGEAVHTRMDTADGRRNNTKPGAGISGQVGGAFRSGANHLSLNYGGSLSTRRDLPSGDQTDSSSVNGASRYDYATPVNPLDFNLGHTVQSVRNNTGFLLNTGDYETRNTLTGGAGLTFHPGEVSSLRFAAQAGKSYGSGDLNNSESQTVTADFSRRLTERSSAGLTARRSWADEDGVDTTIDNAELNYSLNLENGFFSIGAGKSWSEADFPGQATRESDAMTGHLNRTWVGPESSTSLEYNRRLSDSTTDLSLNLPPQFAFLPDTIELRELVVSDAVLVSHNTSKLCDVCSFSSVAQVERLESELSGATTYNYGAALNLGVDITNLHQLTASYSWQADSGFETGRIEQQRHQLILGVSRLLAEDVRMGVKFGLSWVRRKADNGDEEQYGVRMFIAKDFNLTAIR